LARARGANIDRTSCSTSPRVTVSILRSPIAGDTGNAASTPQLSVREPPTVDLQAFAQLVNDFVDGVRALLGSRG
jgi:hypothetical protein